MAAFKSLVLATTAAALTLVVAEASLRALGILDVRNLPPVPTRHEFFVADSNVGYHLWPSTRTCFRYPRNSHHVYPLVSNSDGFASSRELGEVDPRPRVLLLGDSFVMGLGTREGQRFSEVVEEIEPRWRVDNMAMSGWGIDLMVRALEAFAAKARPDAVVLAVYTDDFRRVDPRYGGEGYAFQKFRLTDGVLESVPFPVRSRWQRSRLGEAWYRTTLGDRNRYELNEALVNRFDSLTKAHGAKPAILFLPGRGDTDEDRTRRSTLAGWAQRLHIPFRDLTEPLHGAGVEQTYIVNDPHWNAKGHRIAAEVLHALLASDVLGDAGKDIDVRAIPSPPWRSRTADYCHDGGGSRK